MTRLVLAVGVVSIALLFVGVVHSGKILANSAHVELSDYRFGLGEPYLIFYERENYKGKLYYHRLSKSGCTNLAPSFANQASSVDLQRRCVKLCTALDCGGTCVRVIEDQAPKSSRGVGRLDTFGINDKIMSVKYCYS